MSVKIAPMDRSHLEQIAAIERACFSMPWSEAMLAEELYNDTASFLVAQEDDGTVLGYAGLHAVLDEGYIDNVAVREDCRRQGIARRLVEVYCRFAQANLAFLSLEVRASNEGAIALYTSLGFLQEGRRPGYYDRPREDALIMTRRFKHATKIT